tara:strand:+ start:44 stop:490 length:447 start_codon:yes stop_codon:yes gene_type:complete
MKKFGTIQATMQSIKDKIEIKTAEALEQKFEDIASYAVYNATPDQAIDTGAYVTSFSLGPAGFGGGRSRSSKNKPRGQNPQVMKDQGYVQLQSDIQRINFKAMLESGNTRFTLANRSPHAYAVENGGITWRNNPTGYGVFVKIRSEFR